MRVAFVGQQTFFASCALDGPVADIVPRFFEFRRGADSVRLLGELKRWAPDVVVVFRPDIVPPGLFDDLRATTVGYLTEPLPRGGGSAHADLGRRLWELGQVDPGNFDRIVSFDPLIADSAAQAGLELWRSVPLPVVDRLYGDVRRTHGPPKVLFTGRGTEHREKMLAGAKHHFDVLHVVYGTTDEELERYLREHDVGLNLHNEPYPSFEQRVAVYLAAGLLVLSESLSPQHGLEPGIDYLVCDTSGDVLIVLDRLAAHPGLYDRIRVRGRRKAELFRASRVWPRVLGDLRLDVAAFGSARIVTGT
jgi:hypothetical protein